MKKIYIEISDICGLECSFCPVKKGARGVMSLELFARAVLEARKHTKIIALHVLGDPLNLQNLSAYLNLAQRANLGVEITTSGAFLGCFGDLEFLLKPPVRQINFSLDAIFELKNYAQFLGEILEFCALKKRVDSRVFVNLRVQNRARNRRILRDLEAWFGVNLLEACEACESLDSREILDSRESFEPRRIRLDSRVILDIRAAFVWDSDSRESFKARDSRESTDLNHAKITCHALKNQLAILANGVIVPCCIDVGGKIALGNIKDSSLKSALNSPRAREMRRGFARGFASEALCQNCDYRKILKTRESAD